MIKLLFFTPRAFCLSNKKENAVKHAGQIAVFILRQTTPQIFSRCIFSNFSSHFQFTRSVQLLDLFCFLFFFLQVGDIHNYKCETVTCQQINDTFVIEKTIPTCPEINPYECVPVSLISLAQVPNMTHLFCLFLSSNTER